MKQERTSPLPILGHARLSPLLAAVLACMVTACGGVRLQTPEEFMNGISRSLQFDAREQCQQQRSSTEYLDCVRRTDRTYEEMRERRRHPDAPATPDKPEKNPQLPREAGR